MPKTWKATEYTPEGRKILFYGPENEVRAWVDRHNAKVTANSEGDVISLPFAAIHSDEEWLERTEALIREYESKIRDIFSTIRERIGALATWKGDTDFTVYLDDCSDTYSFYMIVRPPTSDGAEGTFDVRVEMAEADPYGDDEAFDGRGLSWALTVTTYEGEHVYCCMPYNFTPWVWVDGMDDDAVSERFALMRREADPEDIARAIITRWESDRDPGEQA